MYNFLLTKYTHRRTHRRTHTHSHTLTHTHRLETEKSQALSELQSRHQREMTTAREQWEQELDKESSQPTYSPARLAREKDDAVSEALRQARLEWLKEKEKLVVKLHVVRAHLDACL